MADSLLKNLRRGFINGLPNFILNGGFLGRAAKAAFGYTTGAGGTVTQLTNKTTAFTLDTVTGTVTLAAGAVAGYAATASATWTNSAFTSASVVAWVQTSGTVGQYIWNVICSAGTAQAVLTNVSSASLNEVVQFDFVVIQGSAS